MNEDLIRSLYPQHVEEVTEGIRRLLKKYQLSQNRKSKKLNSEDIVLITYGDGIQAPGEAPLDTLSKLGVSHLNSLFSAIHLLPCFPYTSDDGFSVTDYYEINPDLGVWPQLEKLNESFDLMFDAVVNHMSKSSEWFQGFLRGTPAYDEYFIEADPSLDYSEVVRPRALPLLHPFQKEGRTVHIWTTFSEDQVDLNYENPRVFLQVLDILLFYASKGAKYIRLDAIAFLWKKIGTSCIHLEETHMVIQLYRSALDMLGSGTIIITETNVPHEENVSYYGNGLNEAHMVYNFTLPPLLAYSLHKEDITKLTEWAKSLELPSSEVCFFNFTASHDGVGLRPLQGIVSEKEIDDLATRAINNGGFVSYRSKSDGTKSPYELNCNYADLLTEPAATDKLRKERFLLTQSVMLTMPGVPGVYYHSVLGSRNDRASATTSGINRRINREKLNYKDLVTEIDRPGSYRNSIFKTYAKLLIARRKEKAFNPYGLAQYSQEGKLFIIERTHEQDRVFAIHNFSNEAVHLPASVANGLDLLTGKEAASSLPAFGFAWIKPY